MGGIAGFFLGFTLYNFLFALWLKNTVLLAVSSVGGAAILGYVSYVYERRLISILTAILGAYALIRGIAVFAGKYPNEIMIY